MYCQKCGKQIADGSVFCQHCGAQIGNVVSDNFSNQNANSYIYYSRNCFNNRIYNECIILYRSSP